MKSIKPSRKAIAIMIIVGIFLVSIGITAKFVVVYMLLPPEKQHIDFYKQCYTSGGAISSEVGSQCGKNCWDQIQLGILNCGLGEYLYADCFCGEDQCWDEAVGKCASKEQYNQQYGEVVWQQYSLTSLADAMAGKEYNPYNYDEYRFQGKIESGSAIVNMPDGYDKKSDYCTAPYYFTDGTATVRIENNYAQYSKNSRVEIVGSILNKECSTACVCDPLLNVTAIRLLE